MVKAEVASYFFRFAKISGGMLIGILLLGLFAGTDFMLAFTLAYVVTFLVAASNFVVVDKINISDQKKFNRIFLISTSLRFLLTIVALIVVLKGIKIHQIFFTVSFIISYIFHSVIEIIFINKILETDTRDT